MKNSMWILLIGAVIVGAGIILSQGSNSTETEPSSSTDTMVTTSTTTDEPSQDDEDTVEESNANTGEGTYLDYSEQALSDAHDRGDTVALFFHAPWCPDCRALNSEIEAKGVPAGITILKTDFDSETALRQKYGVTTQHTIVEVDMDNNKVNLWRGITLDDIITNLNS